jgi:hypothetical protein
MTAYDRTRGLCTVDTETGRLRSLAHEDMTSDLRFAVRDRQPRLAFARFLAEPFSPIAYDADLFTLDTGSGEVRRLTRDAHLLYPVPLPDGSYLAVRNSQRGGAIVRVEPDGSVRDLVSDPDLRIVGLDVDRESGKILAVANRYGSLGIWLLDRERADGPRLEFLFGMRAGSVLDASWTPDGERIVFSADRDGELDVYVHDLASGSTVRLTRTLYGAMEPAVSPDGSRIAYVRYGPERFDLVVEPFRPGDGMPVDPAGLLDSGALPAPPEADPAASPWLDPEARPYRSARYLRPRMVYPTLYYEDAPAAASDAGLGFGAGLAVQGADPLLRWSYWGEGIWRKGRAWGEAGVMTAAIVTRPALRLYSRPEEVTVLVRPDQGPAFTRRVIREERGARLAMQLPVVLSNNVRSSTLAAGAGLQFEEERLYDDEMQPLTDFLGRLTATGSMGLGLGVQWNLRDLVPSRGLVLGLAGESDLQAENADLRRAVIGTAALYLPWLSRLNVGLRLEAGFVAQSEPTVYDLDYFMPRGQEDLLPVNRSVVRLGAETVVPVVFVDDGMLILPVYVAAVYVYGFGETLLDSEPITSVGGGIGVQVRLFHALGLDLRFGAARRVNRDDWTVVYR